MSLPKLKAPVYEAILPSTEKVIKYRPFLVKEEKILLTAMEDGDEKVIFNAVKQIIKNCIQGNIKVEDLPTFDIEYLFLRLRAKSVGEKVTIGLKPHPCPQNEGELCNNTTEVEINLEEVKVIKSEEHSPKIMLDDKIGIVLGYPDLSLLSIKKGSDSETGMKVIKDSIQMIFTEEETHEKGTFNEKELDDFIDSLNTEQFNKIKDFFDTMPQLKHTAKYKCSTCGEDKETTIQGLNSFFG
jgi:hypothetical protein